MNKHDTNVPTVSTSQYFAELHGEDGQTYNIDMMPYFDADGVFDSTSTKKVYQAVNTMIENYPAIQRIGFFGGEKCVELSSGAWSDISVNDMEIDFIKDILTQWRVNKKWLDAAHILAGHRDGTEAGYVIKHALNPHAHIVCDISVEDEHLNNSPVQGPLNIAVYQDELGNGQAFCVFCVYLGDNLVNDDRIIASTHNLVDVDLPNIISATCDDLMVEAVLNVFEYIVSDGDQKRFIAESLKDYSEKMLRVMNDGKGTTKVFNFYSSFNEVFTLLEKNVLLSKSSARKTAGGALTL